MENVSFWLTHPDHFWDASCTHSVTFFWGFWLALASVSSGEVLGAFFSDPMPWAIVISCFAAAWLHFWSGRFWPFYVTFVYTVTHACLILTHAAKIETALGTSIRELHEQQK